MKRSLWSPCFFPLVCLIVGFLSSPLLAQTAVQSSAPWEAGHFTASAEEVRAAAAGITAEPYALATILLEERVVRIDEAQRASQTMHMVYRVEKASALPDWGTVKTIWSPWMQKTPQIRARVFAVDGKVYELDPKVLTDVPAHDQRPEIYEDQRAISGPLPNVQPGAIVEVEYQWEDTAPSFAQGALRRFYLGNNVPTQHILLTVSAPSSLPLRYRTRGSVAAKVERTEKDGLVTLRIEQRALPSDEELEKYLPSQMEIWPAVDYTTVSSWNALAEDYSAKVQAAIQPAEAAVLLEGTNGLKGQELLRAIVTNLHKRVRYTGMEFGSSAVVPRPASEVLRIGYGDCKDKAVTLISALKAAGIDARLALLHTRGVMDVSNELPGLNLFNHAIVYLPGKHPQWIDATAEFSMPGSLPWDDQGRQAFVVDKGTSGLILTPFERPEDNVEIMRREVHLSEYGEAKFEETLEGVGLADSVLRQRYGLADSKEAREALERYESQVYMSEKMTDFSHGAGLDLTKPFRVQLALEKGRRGYTDLKTSVIYLPNLGMLWDSPDYVTDDDGTDKPQTPGWKPRKNDIELPPYATEWYYHIVPPVGFGLPTVPKDDVVKFGPASLTRSYRIESDGSVNVLWRFSSGGVRMTPAELKEFQVAINQFTHRDLTSVAFRQKAAALQEEGRNREALAAYRELIQLHPREGLHHLQMALALLDAGFGDMARAEAKVATELDPGNADVWGQYGWVLEHDDIGRRFGKGFHREASLAAYRKAMELNPKEWTFVADYAILLEHNAYGERYQEGADLKGAVEKYRLLKQLKPERAEGFYNNLAFALLYDRKWQDAIEFCASVPNETWRTAITLAAVAEQDGSKAAEAEAGRLSSAAANRSSSLFNAAGLLVRLRDYPLAVELYRAAEPGQSDPAAVRARIQAFQNARRFERPDLPPSDPRYAVQAFYFTQLDSHAAPEKIYEFIDPDPVDAKRVQAEADSEGVFLRRYFQLESDEPPLATRDRMLSNLQIAVEGSDATGYRMRVRAAENWLLTFFVVHRSGGYHIVGVDSDSGLIGREVLEALRQNNPALAKHWLDWAREQIKLNAGDDPLGGALFAHFWSRGDKADPARMRLAALAMLSQYPTIRDYMGELKAAQAASSGEAATRMDLLLAAAAFAVRDRVTLQEAASRLVEAYPLSETALNWARSASELDHDAALAERAVRQRLAELPDDIEALRTSADAASAIGDFEKARKVLKGIIDKNRAELSDLNQYTWIALFQDGVSEQDVQLLQKAISASNKRNSAATHTLACLYAEIGRTHDARELLLEAMNAGGMLVPDESIWYGLGRIAEQYGLIDEAEMMYARVLPDKDGIESELSTYNLARHRLAIMKRASASTTGSEARGK